MNRKERALVAADESAGFVVGDKAKNLARVAARNQRNRPKRPRSEYDPSTVVHMAGTKATVLKYQIRELTPSFFFFLVIINISLLTIQETNNMSLPPVKCIRYGTHARSTLGSSSGEGSVCREKKTASVKLTLLFNSSPQNLHLIHENYYFLLSTHKIYIG